MNLSIEGLRLFPPNLPRVFITSQPDKTRRRPATEFACLLLWNLQQRAATTTRINGLKTRYRKTKNPELKAEMDRLMAELEGMPERWNFVERQV
jgi:hypothetical protein